MGDRIERRDTKRPYRLVKNRGSFGLSAHEADELAVDFDLDVDGWHVITVVTKEEWYELKRARRDPVSGY